MATFPFEEGKSILRGSNTPRAFLVGGVIIAGSRTVATVIIFIVCVSIIGALVIYDQVDATYDDAYSFEYDGYTVSQTSGSSDEGIVTIGYSVVKGDVTKAYSVGYTLTEDSRTASIKSVTGEYSVLIIPPIVKYNGVEYTVNDIGQKITGADSSNPNQTLTRFVLAADDSTGVGIQKNAFTYCVELSEVTIGGIVSANGSWTNQPFSGCLSLTKMDFGVIGAMPTQNAQQLIQIKSGQTVETDVLIVTAKTTSDSIVCKLINGSSLPGSVILRLAEGSVKMNTINCGNIKEIQVYSGDDIWSDNVEISALATNSSYVGDELVIKCYSHVTVAQTVGGTVTGAGTFVAGENVPVVVTPADGCVCSRLYYTLGNDEVNIENGSFIMPAGNVEIHAVFADEPVDNGISLLGQLSVSGKYATVDLTVSSDDPEKTPSFVKVFFRFSSDTSADSYAVIRSTVDCTNGPHSASMSVLYPDNKLPVECLLQVFNVQNVLLAQDVFDVTTGA